MSEHDLAEPAFDHLLSVLAARAAADVMERRAARRGARPDDGFATVVAWLWSTRPDRAVSLAVRWVSGTQTGVRRLPGPPAIDELLDDGLHPALLPVMGSAATRTLLVAVREALASGPHHTVDSPG